MANYRIVRGKQKGTTRNDAVFVGDTIVGVIKKTKRETVTCTPKFDPQTGRALRSRRCIAGSDPAWLVRSHELGRPTRRRR